MDHVRYTELEDVHRELSREIGKTKDDLDKLWLRHTRTEDAINDRRQLVDAGKYAPRAEFDSLYAIVMNQTALIAKMNDNISRMQGMLENAAFPDTPEGQLLQKKSAQVINFPERA